MVALMYHIHEVNGLHSERVLRFFNSFEPEKFPELEHRHLRDGYWWLARGTDNGIVGFAGLVPMEPFKGVGYLKRAFVVPSARGHSLQRKFIYAREAKARMLNWWMLVSECDVDNVHSRRNFESLGFVLCSPEQPWGKPNSIYFQKVIA